MPEGSQGDVVSNPSIDAGKGRPMVDEIPERASRVEVDASVPKRTGNAADHCGRMAVDARSGKIRVGEPLRRGKQAVCGELSRQIHGVSERAEHPRRDVVAGAILRVREDTPDGGLEAVPGAGKPRSRASAHERAQLDIIGERHGNDLRVSVQIEHPTYTSNDFENSAGPLAAEFEP